METILKEETLNYIFNHNKNILNKEVVGNLESIGFMAKDFASRLGIYNPQELDDLFDAAIYHDIGKIYLPFLSENKKLTEEEFKQVKLHPVYGFNSIKDEVSPIIKNVILYHHENFNGTGYIFGLKGDKIPMEARIIKIFDVFDALRSPRSYKSSFTLEDTLRRMTEGDERIKPSHFDPELLDEFMKNYERYDYLLHI